jgi:uncharacterized membrane protein YcaP (DUF421 family)
MNMSALWGGAGGLGFVALKAALLYLTAILGFRIGERRTLAEMSVFDFVAAVAIGAIVGRVPNASTTSYLEGAATLVTILVAHSIIARLRYFPRVSGFVDHPPRVLVTNGKILERELRRSGLTREDLYGLLRQHGYTSIDDVKLVVFEQRGKISVVSRGAGENRTSDLIRDFAKSQPHEV